MIQEFALEPKVISTWSNFRYFVEQFGVEHGRLISKFPRKWKLTVFKKCEERARKEPGELNLLRIIEKLKDPEYIDKKMMSSGREYNSAMPWIENAEYQHRFKPFHAIIATSNPNKHPHIVLSDEIDDSNPLWKVRTEITIERNPKKLAQCAAPLLEISGEIVIIDPYFEFVNKDIKSENYGKPIFRFTDTLKELIDCSFRGKPPKSIKLHVKHTNDPNKDKKQSLQRWENDCFSRLSKLIPEGSSIRVFRWKKCSQGKKLHPRFILTECGGIQYDVGLDSGPIGEETIVKLLSEILHDEIWKDFQPESAAFDLIDEIEVAGTRL
ncbi:MAG: hypothetical protein C0392_04185 [Syntrophus sp. (in: bacteria)]|nr:hypothetical protein [Syntrophus sp. (in: bacteria)]